MTAGPPIALIAPIDVSQEPDFTPRSRIGIVARSGQGHRQQRLVTFEKRNKAIAQEETSRQASADWTLVDYLFSQCLDGARCDDVAGQKLEASRIFTLAPRSGWDSRIKSPLAD